MENMQNMGGEMKNMCKCPHHSVMPIFAIAFGAVFLLGYWGILPWMAVNTIWPIVVILGGTMKWMERSQMCKCC